MLRESRDEQRLATNPVIATLEILAGDPILISAQAVAPAVRRAACFDLFALIWQANWSA
jgi:hypothetical protein